MLGAILGARECSSEEIHKDPFPNGAYTLVGGRKTINKAGTWEKECMGVSVSMGMCLRLCKKKFISK